MMDFGTGSEAAAQTSQLESNLVRTQYPSSASSFDGTDGHAGKARRSRVLRKCDAAGFLDGLYAEGTVGAATGEDNPDCASATFCG
jgi:hypothetical protein